jgi:broad specificity phosphatase PhoE
VRLSVVRHGETAFNCEDRLTGQRDIPLSPLGQRQARLVGAYLADRPISVIVCSDLQRTRLTARAIAEYHDLTVEEDPDIREISLGEWEGQTIEEVAARDPELVRNWRQDGVLYAPPGGETLPQVRRRVARALDRWSTRYPDGHVLWVAHGGLIGVLICHLLDIDLNRRRQFRHANASLTEFVYTAERIEFVHLNETGYLSRIKEPVASDREA